MLRWIIETSLKFRLIAFALTIAIIVLAVIALRMMPVDVLPEFAPPYIQVQTEALGLSDTEVEELVTFNLEELLNGTPWLKAIRSTSVPGLSSIFLLFEPGTDVMRARQLVNERLTLSYALPNVASPPVILQPLSATSRVMMVGLSSKKVSLIDMSVLALWNIRPALLSIPGVANVAIWGMRDKQLQVQVTPETLAANKLQLDQIISTTGNALWVSPLTFLNASTPGSGGWIETPQQRLEVRHVLPISTPEDLRLINIEDTTLTLGQVSNILKNHQPLIGDDVLNNGSGLLIVIDKFPGANAPQVTHDVEEKLKEMQPGLSGIEIDTSIFKPAVFVNMLMENTSIVLGLGFLFLTLGLLILLRSWRAVLISIITVPAALGIAVLVLALRGTTLNIMVLGGLMVALLIVIDDVVANIENILQRFRLNDTQPASNIIIGATLETSSSMLYATFILVLATIPIYFLSGLAPALFRPLALSYLLAIIASLLTTVTIVPALAALFFANTIKRKDSVIVSGLQKTQPRLNNYITRLAPSNLFLGIVIACICASILGLTVLIFYKSPSTIPAFREPNIMINWEGPPGTSLKEMVRITELLSKELQKIPGVTNVAAHIGRAILGDQIVDVNSAELVVNVKPDEDYTQSVASIKKAVNSYPGMFNAVQNYLQEKTRQVLTGTTSDFVVRIFGPDFKVLREKANEIARDLAQLDGVKNLHVDQQIEQPQINIQVDLAKAQNVGITPGDVRRAAAVYIAGLQVGSLFEDQKIFPVVVWGQPSVRDNVDSIKNLDIDVPVKFVKSGIVKLSDIASVSIDPTPSLIKHDTVSRYIDVSFNIKAGKAKTVIPQLRERIKNMTFPLEFRTDIQGAYIEQQAAFNKLALVVACAAILTFLLLQAAFGSFVLAVVVFLCLPVAFLGSVIVAFLLNGISMAVLFGLLAVFAIALRNMIMLVRYAQRLEYSNSTASPMLQAVNDKFAPMLISLIISILVLLPFAFACGYPGLEITSSMALIILGGLVSVLILSLLIIPSLYIRFEMNPPGRRKEDATL